LQQALELGTYKSGISDYASEALEAVHDVEKYPQFMRWKTNG
jgi:hypothetical protein